MCKYGEQMGEKENFEHYEVGLEMKGGEEWSDMRGLHCHLRAMCGSMAM